MQIASNEIRTRVIGFKVQCADHYTMEAKTRVQETLTHSDSTACLYIKMALNDVNGCAYHGAE